MEENTKVLCTDKPASNSKVLNASSNEKPKSQRNVKKSILRAKIEDFRTFNCFKRFEIENNKDLLNVDLPEVQKAELTSLKQASHEKHGVKSNKAGMKVETGTSDCKHLPKNKTCDSEATKLYMKQKRLQRTAQGNQAKMSYLKRREDIKKNLDDLRQTQLKLIKNAPKKSFVDKPEWVGVGDVLDEKMMSESLGFPPPKEREKKKTEFKTFPRRYRKPPQPPPEENPPDDSKVNTPEDIPSPEKNYPDHMTSPEPHQPIEEKATEVVMFPDEFVQQINEQMMTLMDHFKKQFTPTSPVIAEVSEQGFRGHSPRVKKKGFFFSRTEDKNNLSQAFKSKETSLFNGSSGCKETKGDFLSIINKKIDLINKSRRQEEKARNGFVTADIIKVDNSNDNKLALEKPSINLFSPNKPVSVDTSTSMRHDGTTQFPDSPPQIKNCVLNVTNISTQFPENTLDKSLDNPQQLNLNDRCCDLVLENNCLSEWTDILKLNKQDAQRSDVPKAIDKNNETNETTVSENLTLKSSKATSLSDAIGATNPKDQVEEYSSVKTSVNYGIAKCLSVGSIQDSDLVLDTGGVENLSIKSEVSLLENRTSIKTSSNSDDLSDKISAPDPVHSLNSKHPSQESSGASQSIRSKICDAKKSDSSVSTCADSASTPEKEKAAGAEKLASRTSGTVESLKLSHNNSSGQASSSPQKTNSKCSNKRRLREKFDPASALLEMRPLKNRKLKVSSDSEDVGKGSEGVASVSQVYRKTSSDLSLAGSAHELNLTRKTVDEIKITSSHPKNSFDGYYPSVSSHEESLSESSPKILKSSVPRTQVCPVKQLSVTPSCSKSQEANGNYILDQLKLLLLRGSTTRNSQNSSSSAQIDPRRLQEEILNELKNLNAVDRDLSHAFARNKVKSSDDVLNLNTTLGRTYTSNDGFDFLNGRKRSSIMPGVLDSSNSSLISSNFGHQKELSNISSEFTFNANNMSKFSLRMFENLCKDEERRYKQQLSRLESRKAAVLEKAKTELIWLSQEKKCQKLQGREDALRSIKKKERGIVLKCHQDLDEIQRLQKSEKEASRVRILLLKRQRHLILMQYNANEYNKKLSSSANKYGKKSMKTNGKDVLTDKATRNSTSKASLDLQGREHEKIDVNSVAVESNGLSPRKTEKEELHFESIEKAKAIKVGVDRGTSPLNLGSEGEGEKVESSASSNEPNGVKQKISSQSENEKRYYYSDSFESPSPVFDNSGQVPIADKKSLQDSSKRNEKKSVVSIKVPLSPRIHVNKRKYSSGSDESILYSQNETSEASDLETRVCSLQHQLMLKEAELENLKRLQIRSHRERLKAKEQAIISQINACDAHIEQIKAELEQESELSLVKVVKPQIKQPRVAERRKSDVAIVYEKIKEEGEKRVLHATEDVTETTESIQIPSERSSKSSRDNLEEHLESKALETVELPSIMPDNVTYMQTMESEDALKSSTDQEDVPSEGSFEKSNISGAEVAGVQTDDGSLPNESNPSSDSQTLVPESIVKTDLCSEVPDVVQDEPHSTEVNSVPVSDHVDEENTSNVPSQTDISSVKSQSQYDEGLKVQNELDNLSVTVNTIVEGLSASLESFNTSENLVSEGFTDRTDKLVDASCASDCSTPYSLDKFESVSASLLSAIQSAKQNNSLTEDIEGENYSILIEEPSDTSAPSSPERDKSAQSSDKAVSGGSERCVEIKEVPSESVLNDDLSLASDKIIPESTLSNLTEVNGEHISEKVMLQMLEDSFVSSDKLWKADIKETRKIGEETPFLKALQREKEKDNSIEGISLHLFNNVYESSASDVLKVYFKKCSVDEGLEGSPEFEFYEEKVEGEVDEKKTFWQDERATKVLAQQEAEKLRLKQLQIEQEIEELELEAAASARLSGYYVREIPNKPPPPYTARRGRGRPSAGETLSAVEMAISTLWELTGGKTLPPGAQPSPPADFLSSMTSAQDIQFRDCLWDLCIQIYLEMRPPPLPSCPPWLVHKKRKKLAPLPRTKEEVLRLAKREVSVLFGYEPAVQKENMIIRWSRKKRDTVDEILVRESQEEEGEWIDYSFEENLLKNRIVNSITQNALQEASTAISKAFQVKFKNLSG